MPGRRPRAALLSPLLACLGASALKAPSHHGADPEVSHLPRAVHGAESFDAEAAQVVRNIKDFTKWSSLWREMAAGDERANASLEEGALIMGVFSIASATEHQKVIRETWMNQRGVCNLMGEDVPRAGCSVYVAFVMGRDNHSTSSRAPLGDGLYLDMEENMDGGKSMMFFRTASYQFPWATHIAKVDMDAFPFLHKVMTNLYGSGKPCRAKYEYWGAKYGTRECNNTAWGRSFIANCPDDSCAKRLPCADYVQGGMYGLSRDLAFETTRWGEAWTTHPTGPEDRNAGTRLHQWSQKHSKCVSMWMMADSFFHMTPTRGAASYPSYGDQSNDMFYHEAFW